jgi:hypothetical protein
VELLTDRKRSLAALTAAGVPLGVLEHAQRWEAAMVSLPISVAGVAVIRVALVACVLGLIWLALIVSARAVRPWLLRAVDPENLRTA